jgi:hypothetical protein
MSMHLTGRAMNPRVRFDHLLSVISSSRFLIKQGLGNEVPFFICPYPASEAATVEAMRVSLVNQLANRGVKVLEINLYDLSVELLQQRGIWDKIIEAEPEMTKSELLELLQAVLAPEEHLVPAIAKKITDQQFDVLFLSGVGEIFPFIRSHNVLNNLQSTAKEKPTVLFFPGSYTHAQATGASLDLFDLPHEDRYYRAFNILNYEV